MRAMLRDKDKQQATTTKSAPKSEAAAITPAGLWYAENVPGAPRWDDGHRVSVVEQGQSQPLTASSGLTQSNSRPQVELGRDVIDRDILSMATARQLFETYRNDLFPHNPMVVVPASVTADDWRRTKPMLFLAMISAAAGKDQPELSATLDREVLHTYAQRSLVQSEKSLELVQALLVSAVWYHIPSRYGQLKYYEYIHMAATMAVDLGIGSREVPHQSRHGDNGLNVRGRPPHIHPLEDASNPDLSMTPRSRDPSPHTGDLESRRTFLGCYTMCTVVALSLRRSNMLRTTSYIKECIEYMDQSPQALPSDRTLLAWTRLAMIGNEISASFSYDDPGGIACITELRTQLMLRDYTKRLDQWFASVPEADMCGSLRIVYLTTRLYLHEIALHTAHSPEDFRAPYQMGMIHAWDGDEVPTQILAETVAECISSTHNMFDVFLNMDVESCRGLPVLIFVRVSFAAFILAKICLSASHPGSQISRVLDRSSLKAESVLDRAILHVRAIIGPTRCRVPAIFLALLFKLRQWCLNPKLIEPPRDNILDPAMRDTAIPNQSSASEEDAKGDEQDSEEDSSPQSYDDSHESAYDDGMDAVNAIAYASNKTRLPPEYTPESQFDAMTIPVEAPSDTFDTGYSAPQVGTVLNADDQMHLDENFFHFFEDMRAVSGEEFVGMNDWASVPTDMLGLPNDFNWQTMPAAGQSAMQWNGMDAIKPVSRENEWM